MTPVFKNDDIINDGCGFLKKKFPQNVPRKILGKVKKFQEYLIRNKTFANERGEGGSTRPT